MKQTVLWKCGAALAAALGLAAVSPAQTSGVSPRLADVTAQTNGEISLAVTGGAGATNSIDVSANLQTWRRWITLQVPQNGLSRQTDSAAPFLIERYYRLVPDTDAMTGDHLPTDDGDVVVHPIGHAAFMLQWKGLLIFNDPDSGLTGDPRAYLGAKADLILVSHEHGDHFDLTTLNALRKTNTVLVAPRNVYNSLSATLKAQTIVLTNGASTQALGMQVEAVPAYNNNHSRGAGNGYVLTIGGRRFYMSGDTGNTAEMRALANIDVAFLSMNLPFTMSVADAVAAVRGFHPKIVYPYHFRQDGTPADLNLFKRQVMADPGTEVRLRKWY